jgi:hypothetical protein
MSGAGGVGRTLLVVAAVLAVLGLVLILADRFPGTRIGRLPGDISVERGNFRFYFPLATSIVASIVFSVLFWLFGRRG